MITPLNPRARLDTTEAAEYIGVKPKTLHNWRSAGTGPPCLRIGNQYQYVVADIDGWLQARRVA